jgi:type IV pilus assembly protein PilF
MNGLAVLAWPRGLVAATLAWLLLTGCQPGTLRDDEVGDATGDLGESRQESPADLYVQLAVGYLQNGQTATALRKVRHGLELDPNNARAHNVIALIYQRLGENSLAAEHFAKAIELQPKDPFIRNAYGSFLCGEKRYDEALQQFEGALANPLYGTPEVAMTNAGICARRAGRLDLAEQYLRRALQRDDKFSLALLQMAQLSFDTGNYTSARAYLQRYVEVAPQTAETLGLGIRTERRLGDSHAVADYEAMLLKQFPDAPEVQLLNGAKRQ